MLGHARKPRALASMIEIESWWENWKRRSRCRTLPPASAVAERCIEPMAASALADSPAPTQARVGAEDYGARGGWKVATFCGSRTQ